MKILGFDTSGASGSIALSEDGRLIAEIETWDVGAHSEWFLPAVDSLLKENSVAMEDIDLFAVGIGPGSFTGLRIGVSGVKGFAWALGKKCVAVSTLEAMAMNERGEGQMICPVLDARKKEVYAALFSCEEGRLKRLAPDSVMSPHEVADMIERSGDGPVVFLGGGMEIYGEAILNAVKDASIGPKESWRPRGRTICSLGFEARNEARDPKEISPVYLRKSEAEIKASRQRP
ncbi:MAG: tRNA (adenosine(37)-N6)-threonylcarbamoyltransferase complex dimerization subunit type 1 TsaB [Thermodesulfobacteriota bacterium]